MGQPNIVVCSGVKVLVTTSNAVALGIGRGYNVVARFDENGKIIPKSGNPALWGLHEELAKKIG